VRYEQTLTEGSGPKNDIRATLRQDANGNLIRDANGRPIPVSTDPYQTALLRYTMLGARAEGDYDGYYPSLNLRYTLTDTLTARAAYARSIGRPGLGSILPGTTITDPDVANPTITVNNPELKPWTADSYEVSLEWYVGRNGFLTASAYRKSISDFFASSRQDATEALLADYFLPIDYLNYDIVTQTNIPSSVRIDGLELGFRQALTFLPDWARGLQLNGSLEEDEGSKRRDAAELRRQYRQLGPVVQPLAFLAPVQLELARGVPDRLVRREWQRRLPGRGAAARHERRVPRHEALLRLLQRPQSDQRALPARPPWSQHPRLRAHPVLPEHRRLHDLWGQGRVLSRAHAVES